MKSATPALASLLQTGSFVHADLYTFTLTDGSLLRYTTSDRAVTISGVTWTASGPFVDAGASGGGRSQKSTATQKTGLDVDTRTIAIQPRAFDPFSGAAYPDRISGQPFLMAVAAGALDGALVQMDRAYWASWAPVNSAMPAPVGVISALFAGRVAGIEFDRGVANITLNSHLELLSQQVPRNTYGPSCRHTLFDAGCALIQANYAVAGTVASVASKSNFASAIGAPTGSATYALGRILFSSGQNKGVTRLVRSWTNGTFQLLAPVPYQLQVGDGFTAYPGCDKSQGTCRLFNNISNFGGMPYIPVVETAV